MSLKKKVGGPVVSARGAPLSARRAATTKTTASHAVLTPRQASGVAALAAATPLTDGVDGIAAAAAAAAATPLMNPYGLGVGSVSSTSLYWHNLLLLGFNPAGQSARHKIDLSPSMFDRPNARAMQLLLHFLLTSIRSCPQSDAHNDAPEWKEMMTIFQHSYPCVERTQTRDFLHVCVQVLTGFEKGPAGVFPPGTIRKSHFAAPQGERLYTIFWHLSSYALHLTLQRDHPSYPVPSLSLPSLSEHALFPHTIKAMKAHIVRQSQLYITKLQRMQTAEEGWRTAAAEITAEYQSCQSQMNELTVPAAPRIPGQPAPEIESDRLLFSAPAHAERMRKLQFVKELHSELDSLHAKTEQQRVTLNMVLNGAWKPMTLNRLHLDKLMGGSGSGTAAANSTDAAVRPALSSSSSSSAQSAPLNFQHIVQQWTDSLGKMQGVLTQYLHSPSSSSQYLSGLHQAQTSVEQHLKEHNIKLTNLRTLSHHLRSSLLPELESDLAALQLELTRAGTYSGPISTPPSLLIPPTPFRSNQPNTSLAVPQTPATMQHGTARVHFTPSNQTAQRPASRISDSVRRAAQHKAVRQAHQRDYMLSTIVDEEQQSPAASLLASHGHSTIRSVAAMRQHTPEETAHSALTSPPPQGSHGGGSGGAGANDGTSPQFPKKLVFSPDSASAASATSSPRGASAHRDAPLSRASTSSVRTRDSFSPSFALPSQHTEQTSISSTGRSRFVSPPPLSSSLSHATPPVSHSSYSSSRFHMSPSNLTGHDADEGLLGQDELFDDLSHASRSPQEYRPSRYSTATVDSAEQGDGTTHDLDEEGESDDDEDEVVFGGVSANPSRRVSSTSVDPNAPTPVVRRTERKYADVGRTPDPPPSHSRSSTRNTSIHSFMSPSYQVDGQGLLDDDY